MLSQKLVNGSQGEQEALIQSNETNNTGSGIEEENEIHQKVLDDSTKLMNILSYTSIFIAYTYSTLTPIQVLYGKEFEWDIVLISGVLFGSELLYGIAAIFGTQMAKYVGFDNLLFSLFIIAFCGVFLESISNNIQTWAVGCILVRQPLMYLVIGYINVGLPKMQSKNVSAKYYQFYLIIYLFGPAVAGIYLYNYILYVYIEI